MFLFVLNSLSYITIPTLGTRGFSRVRREFSRGFAFGQTPKIPAAREKNLWYPGYSNCDMLSNHDGDGSENAALKGYFCSFIFCDYSNLLIQQILEKERKKLPWCVTSSTKHRIRIFRVRSWSCTDDKEMYRKAWRMFRVVVVIFIKLTAALLTFPLTVAFVVV